MADLKIINNNGQNLYIKDASAVSDVSITSAGVVNKLRDGAVVINPIKDLTASGVVNLNGTTNIDSATIGDLIVTGGASFTNPINGDITGDAGTVNGHTVEKDVPADANFTTGIDTAAATKATAVYLLGQEGTTAKNDSQGTYKFDASVYVQQGGLVTNNVKATSTANQSANKFFATDGTIQSIEKTSAKTDITSSGTKLVRANDIYNFLADTYLNNGVQYLGTVANTAGLIKADPSVGKGDFYRASAEFTLSGETVHVGDIVLAINDKPTTVTSSDWDVLHTEASVVDTWRKVYVNGVQKLGSETNTGNLDISAGQNIALKNVDASTLQITGIPTVIGTQTTVTGAWTGSLAGTGITELYTGLTINYYLPQESSGSATLKLTLDDADNTTTDAVECYYKSNSRLTTHYSAGDNFLLTYYAPNSISVKGTTRTTACWIAAADYNSDDLHQVRLYYTLPYATNDIYRYHLNVTVDESHIAAINTHNDVTGTTKTAFYKGEFDVFGPIFYNVGTAAAGTRMPQATLYNVVNLADLRYSFNITTTTLTAGKNVYLVAKPVATNGGRATIWYGDSGTDYTKCITQTLPTGEDDLIYILLGNAYDGHRVNTYPEKPAYYFCNGEMRRWTNTEVGIIDLT